MLCKPLVGIHSRKTGFELGHLEASIWQKIRVGWECGKKAAPFVNSRKWDSSTKRRFVNSAFNGGATKRRHARPTWTAWFAWEWNHRPPYHSSLMEAKALQEIHEHLKKYHARYSLASLNCRLDVWVAHSSVWSSLGLIDNGMLQPFNSDMRWWQGLNIQVTRTWVARIRSMRTGPGMPKLHWYSVVWWAVLTSMRFSLSWCLGLVRATSPACGESSMRGRRRGRKTRQASTPPCYLTCNNHLLKLCPIPTIFNLNCW